MIDQRLYKQFHDIGRDIFDAGLTSSHGGNLSMRVGDRIIIKRRGAQFRRLVPESARRPLPIALFRQITRWVMRSSFPPEGWETEWVDAGDQCVAFDIHRCFYLDVLTAYGAPELTPLYCKLDDLMYENMSPGIRWARTRTLGRGDDLCDFRWCWEEPRIS